MSRDGLTNDFATRRIRNSSLPFGVSPRQAERRPGSRLSFLSFLPLVDLFNNRAFARFNQICSVVTLDIPILAQARRFPIDLVREGPDLHRIRQTLADLDAGRGGTAGGALFCPGRTSMLADDLAIPVGKSGPVRCRGGRGRSARAR